MLSGQNGATFMILFLISLVSVAFGQTNVTGKHFIFLSKQPEITFSTFTGLVAAGGNGGLKTAEFWAKMPQEVNT